MGSSGGDGGRGAGVGDLGEGGGEIEVVMQGMSEGW